MMIWEITNVVACARMQVKLNMRTICEQYGNVEMCKRMHKVIWRHKSISGTALLYPSGYITVLGSKSVTQAKMNIRKYARLLSKRGYKPILSSVEIKTISGVYRTKSLIKLDFGKLMSEMGIVHIPEIYPGAILRRGKVAFLIYHNGVVVITGIKNTQDSFELVTSTLIEISLCG